MVGLVIGLAVPAVAGGTSDSPGTNQACDTPPGGTTTCFTGSTAIQQAVDNDGTNGGGGTVNVGKGTFSPISITTDGLLLNGSGPGTIIAGTVDDNSNPQHYLIRAFKSTPGFAHQLRVQNLTLLGTAAAGHRGSEFNLRDQNQNNLDTITNVWFAVASDSRGSVRALYAYNSYAPLVFTRNTMAHTQYGLLLETGGGSGTTMFEANSITYNLFDLKLAPSAISHSGVSGIQVSIDNPGPTTSGAQDYSSNAFTYSDGDVNTVGLLVNGHTTGTPCCTSTNGLPTTIGFHSNNLGHVDAGVVNQVAAALTATDTFWGCSTGPDVGSPTPTSGSNACADADQAPGTIYTDPFLTSPAHLEEVGAT